WRSWAESVCSRPAPPRVRTCGSIRPRRCGTNSGGRRAPTNRSLTWRRAALQSCVADDVRVADRIGSSVVRTLLAMLLAAQAPQVGLIGPLPAAAPASTFDVTEQTI